MTLDDKFRDALKSSRDLRAANNSLFEEIRKSMEAVSKLGLEKILPDLKRQFDHVVLIQAQISRINPGIQSLLYGFSQSASLSLSQSIARQLKDISKLAPPISEVFATQVRALRPAIDLMNQVSFQSHFAQVSQISLLAQKSLAQIQVKEIAASFKVDNSIKESFRQSHVSFGQRYAELFRSLEEPVPRLSSILPNLTYFPTVEFYAGAQIIRTTTIIEEEQLSEDEEIQKSLSTETADAVETSLAEINPKLIGLWRGAIRALDSNNPDNVRHFVTSLRELLTHVMHALSPDEEVRNWTKDPLHFHENNPTRRARLLFITREVNHVMLQLKMDTVMDSFRISFTGGFIHATTHQGRDEDAYSSGAS